MLAYRAYLDTPTHIADTICCWLDVHRLACDDHSYQRAASCKTQTLLVLRWLVDATPVYRLAFDSGISQATAYRYLHEALDVIAHYVPSVQKVLADQEKQVS